MISSDVIFTQYSADSIDEMMFWSVIFANLMTQKIKAGSEFGEKEMDVEFLVEFLSNQMYFPSLKYPFWIHLATEHHSTTNNIIVQISFCRISFISLTIAYY